MKKVILTGSIIASLFAGESVMAQDALKDGQLTISGQVRPRFEFRNGFKKPLREGEEAAAFMEQRSRINLMYKKSDFNIKLSVQDVRIWGETGQINKTDGLTSFHEAYGEWTPNKKSALRIGRQELVYDDARILGNLGWAAQARSHDALKYVYTDSTWEFHAIATYNQDGLTAEPGKLQSPSAGQLTNPGGNTVAVDQDLNFALANPYSSQILWFKKKFKGGNITFLALNDLIQKTTTAGNVARLTLGTNPTIKFGDIKLAGSFYYQLGKHSQAQDAGGLLASLAATYTGGKKVIPTIGFDYVSGDDTETTDAQEGFNPLYGTHHKFYGLMDYFYVGNGHGNGPNAGTPKGNQNNTSSGLIDIYAKAVFKLGKPGKILAHAHFFASPTDIQDDLEVDPEAFTPSYLGTELDLVYVKSVAKNVTLKIGTSFMLPTEAMFSAKQTGISGTVGTDAEYNNVGLNNWSWAMIDFKF